MAAAATCIRPSKSSGRHCRSAAKTSQLTPSQDSWELSASKVEIASRSSAAGALRLIVSCHRYQLHRDGSYLLRIRVYPNGLDRLAEPRSGSASLAALASAALSPRMIATSFSMASLPYSRASWGAAESILKILPKLEQIGGQTVMREELYLPRDGEGHLSAQVEGRLWHPLVPERHSALAPPTQEPPSMDIREIAQPAPTATGAERKRSPSGHRAALA